MSRSVPEWIGRNDDAMPHKAVRERLLKIYPVCYICARPFGDGTTVELDHKIPLYKGGENRESNLRPVHKKCHTEKCREEAADRAKVRNLTLRHSGLQTKSKQPFPKRPKQDMPRPDKLPVAGMSEIQRRFAQRNG